MFGFNKETTKKIIHVEGMHCGHCKANVEKALNAISGVRAEVDLDKKTAEVAMKKLIDNSVLKTAVEALGFEVTSIE